MTEISRDLDTTTAIAAKLIYHGIDTSKWGKDKAKSVDDLVREIEAGDCILTTTESGGLLRVVRVARANVYYFGESVPLRLVESKQVFRDEDGNERERVRNSPTSIAEKIKQDETPQDGILRCLREELGVDFDKGVLESPEVSEVIEYSPSYPGLLCHFSYSDFECELSEEQFDPIGYVEVQPDKVTFFEWEPME